LFDLSLIIKISSLDSEILTLEIDNHQVLENILFLHNHPNLPKPATSVQGLFNLPSPLKDNILSSKFSESSLQKVSDLIGYFLGVPLSLKVQVQSKALKTC
jgi:hypothetical protein